MQVSMPGIAIDGDRLSFDVFHDRVRAAIGCDAPIEQARDAGVIQARQDLALGIETIEKFRRLAARDLERGPLLELSVGTFGLVHLAHAAVTDEANDAPRAQPRTGCESVARGLAPSRRWCGLFKEGGSGFAGAQQALELAAQLRLPLRHAREVLGALRVRQSQSSVEVLLDQPPALGVHENQSMRGPDVRQPLAAWSRQAAFDQASEPDRGLLVLLCVSPHADTNGAEPALGAVEPERARGAVVQRARGRRVHRHGKPVGALAIGVTPQ